MDEEKFSNPIEIPVPQVPLQFNPQDDILFRKKLAIPYTTTVPSDTPQWDGERRIYFDATDYWFYVYVGGSWHGTKLNNISFPSGSVQGDILYFNGAVWTRLAPGTSGYVLQTNGASANPSWVAPATTPVWKFGTSSRGGTTASGSQTIAHGLGKTPSYAIVKAGFVTPSSNVFGDSYGSFDGTTQNVAWWVQEPGGGSQGNNETALIIHLTGVSAGQHASLAWDATNLTFTWTRDGAGYTSGTIFFHWQVWG